MAGAGGREVGRISIRVVPNTDGFREKTKAGVESEVAGIEGKVKIAPDLSGFRKKVEGATKGLKADVNLKAQTGRFRAEAAAAAKGLPDATVRFKTSGFAETIAKIRMIHGLVRRNHQIMSIVDGSPLLAAAYGASKGINNVTRAIRFMSKWALIGTAALTLLGPPLVAIGASGAAAALGGVALAAAGVTAAVTGGLVAGMIAFAASSEEVKSAWSATKQSIKQTVNEVNKPVESSLISLAPKVSDAFKQMQPNIARISEDSAKLIDRFGNTLPRLASATGTALEQMFEAGRWPMEQLIDGLPQIVTGMGNMFQRIGSSREIQRIWTGFVNGLPRALERLGNGFHNAAVGAGKLFDWFRSDDLADFREGFSDFWNELKEVDWEEMSTGMEDILNSMGRIAGDTDVQGLVDGLGDIASGISNILDVMNELGLVGTTAGAIGLAVGKEILKELGKTLAGAGMKFILDKLFGTADEILDEAIDIGTGIAGGLLEGLGSGLAESVGRGIGDLIGDLFDGDGEEDVTVNLTIGEIIWPEGMEGPSGPFIVTGVQMPEGAGEFNLFGDLGDSSALTELLASITAQLAALCEQAMMTAECINQFAGSMLVAGPIVGIFGTMMIPFLTAMANAATAVSNVINSINNLIGTLQNAVGSVVGFYSSVISNFGQIPGFIGGIIGNMQGLIDGGIAGMLASWISGWASMVSTVIGKAGELIGVVAGIPGRIVGALGNLGGLLVASGRSLIQGFINGITSMIGAAVAAAQSVVSAVRGLFPFSPAKYGPFSGKGYTTHSGKALMRDFADAMASQGNYAVASAAGVLADVQEAFDDYNQNLVAKPVLEANAKKIADFRKKEAEALAKGNADLNKLAEDRRKMLESLEVPDYRKMDLSFQAYYIDGAKGMLEQSIKNMRLDTQLKSAVMDAVKLARTEFGDHPFLAQVEANVNAEHFQWAVEKVIEESQIAAVPIEFVISNLDQLKQDLGFGNGVIPTAIDAALNYNPNDTDAYLYEQNKQEIHYHVADMQEAIRLEEERQLRGALRYV